MTAYWTAPDGNGDDTIWTGTLDRPTAVVRRCDLAVPAAFDDLAAALATDLPAAVRTLQRTLIRRPTDLVARCKAWDRVSLALDASDGHRPGVDR